jgi:hypothetical protein
VGLLPSLLTLFMELDNKSPQLVGSRMSIALKLVLLLILKL